MSSIAQTKAIRWIRPMLSISHSSSHLLLMCLHSSNQVVHHKQMHQLKISHQSLQVVPTGHWVQQVSTYRCSSSLQSSETSSKRWTIIPSRESSLYNKITLGVQRNFRTRNRLTATVSHSSSLTVNLSVISLVWGPSKR